MPTHTIGQGGDFWPAVQGIAAVLQAVLSAGAVGAAAWLQDRSIQKREQAAQRERCEAIARIAVYAHAVVAKASEKFDRGQSPDHVLTMFDLGDLDPAADALASMRPIELADAELTTAVLALRSTFGTALRRLSDVCDQARAQRANGYAVYPAVTFGDAETQLFNAAASVERRVAQLSKRAPRM